MPDAVGAASDDWDVHWDRYGNAASANPANEYRWALIRTQLEKGGRLDRIVDVGSGQGELTLRLATAYPQSKVCGLEYSASGVRRSEAAAQSAGLEAQFIQADLLEARSAPGLPAGWATAAICSEVLEHVDRPEVLLGNALEYMAPGCRLVVTVPAGPRTAFDRHIGHRRHFSPRLLERVLTGAGLEVEEIHRAGFPFFNVYKVMVLLRGRRLITDVEHSGQASQASKMTGLVSRVFGSVFRWNLASTPLGWQLVAVARKPGQPA